MSKIYKSYNVLEAAKRRISWLFDEFANVVVNVSGGKDSTVIFHLALEIARQKGRLPLVVMFIDQEAEWQATIDIIEKMMSHKDVKPLWFQMPIRLFNATSKQEHWLYCWNEADRHRWIRDKTEISIKENTFGTDRFHDLFPVILKKLYPKESACYLTGVRAEESPVRFLAMQGTTYKGETWGKKLSKTRGHYSFHPIYDWSYMDVWKAIHAHKWDYCRIYDEQYRYGVPLQNMRVSNLHHETAVHSLFYLQEIEPNTYERLTQRLEGIDMAGKIAREAFFVNDLPYMFKSWQEYRDYLLDKLIDKQEWKDGFKKRFAKMEVIYKEAGDKLYKAQITSILANDWEFIKLDNFERRPENMVLRKKYRGEFVYE